MPSPTDGCGAISISASVCVSMYVTWTRSYSMYVTLCMYVTWLVYVVSSITTLLLLGVPMYVINRMPRNIHV